MGLNRASHKEAANGYRCPSVADSMGLVPSSDLWSLKLFLSQCVVLLTITQYACTVERVGPVAYKLYLG